MVMFQAVKAALSSAAQSAKSYAASAAISFNAPLSMVVMIRGLGELTSCNELHRKQSINGLFFNENVQENK